MRITANLKVGNNTQQYSKSYKSHPMRKHIKIVRGNPSDKSILKLSSEGWIIADQQKINGKKYEEFHKDFKGDSNTNINSKLKNYVVGTSYLEAIHNYLQFEKPTWLPYQTKRNKTQKRSRQVSFYDKMLYGKSKKKFTRDRRRYGRKLKRYHKKMADYDSKVDDWRKSHPNYTTKQLNHFIKKNHPRKPSNPFGKRPLKNMIITIGNHEIRSKIHDLVNKKYKDYPKAKRQEMLLKADLNYDLQAVREFDKDLGPNATVISFTTNPDEIGKLQSNGKLSKTAGANHVHLTIAFKAFTNSKHNKPSCNFNNYLKARTNQSRPNQALSSFKDVVDRDVVRSTGNVLKRYFPRVNQFKHFRLLRTGLGNGVNLLMSRYKTKKELEAHYKKLLDNAKHQYSIKDSIRAKSSRTRESNYKYNTQKSLGNQLTSSADVSASNTIATNKIKATSSAQNAINNEWADARNSVANTQARLNTFANNKISNNSVTASNSASASASSVVSSITDSLNTSANSKVSSISTSLTTSATTDIASNSISANNSAQVIVNSNSASASTTSSEFTIKFQSVNSKSSDNASSASSLATAQSKLATQQNTMRKQQQAWHITETREQRKLKEQKKLIDNNKDVLNSINTKISRAKSIYYGFRAKINTHKLKRNKNFANLRNTLIQGFSDTLTKNQSINDRKLRQQRNNQAKHTGISKFKHGIDKLFGTTPQQRQVKSYKAAYNQDRDTKLSNYWNIMSKWNHGKLPSNIQTTNYVDSLKNTVPETWRKHVKSISSAYGVGVLSYYQSVIPSLNTSNASASRATNAQDKKRMQRQKAIKSMHKSNQAQMATPADMRQEQIKSLGKELNKSSKPTNTRTVPKITQSDITSYARNHGSGIGGR